MADYRGNYNGHNDGAYRGYDGSRTSGRYPQDRAPRGDEGRDRGYGARPAHLAQGQRHTPVNPDDYTPLDRHPSGRPKTVRRFPQDQPARERYTQQPPAADRYHQGGYERRVRDTGSYQPRRDYGYQDRVRTQPSAQGWNRQWQDAPRDMYPEEQPRPSSQMGQGMQNVLDHLRDNPRIIAVIIGAIAVIILICSIVSCAISAANDTAVVPAVSVSTSTDAEQAQDQATGAEQTQQTVQTQASAADQTQATGADQAQAPAASTPNEVWAGAVAKVDNQTQYTSGGVEDPWSPTGWFTTGDPELDRLVKEYADANSTSDLDAGDNAYYTYLHISWWEYVENEQNQRPWDLGDNWTIEYAKRALTTHEANCYDFAAVLMYVMRYFGYEDAVAEPCLILRQSGSWGDHGLVFLTSLDGRPSLLDASLSSNGWLLDANVYTYQLDDGYRA